MRKIVLFVFSLLLVPVFALPQELKRSATETPISRISISPETRRSLTVSPDNRSVAFVSKKNEKYFVTVNGQNHPDYDEIIGDEICSGLIFSPDSRRIAYIARSGRWKYIVADGNRGDRYEDILSYPIFSPDSKNMAFVARAGKKEFVVVNGVEKDKFDEIRASGIRIGKVTFSPDSRSFAYVARLGNEQFVVKNDVRLKEYDIIGSSALFRWDIPVFSPDSSRLAYQVKTGAKWFAVIDGIEEKNGYDMVSSLIFSPDSRRTGYVASSGKKSFVVVDGKEGKEYDAVDLLAFSPDGKSFAYRAFEYSPLRTGGHWFFVLNDREVKKFRTMGDSFGSYGDLLFSPDSGKVAYKSRYGIVLHDKEEKHYEKTGSPVFSPDCRSLAYMAGSNDKQFIIVNSQQGKPYDSLDSRFFLADPVFSPDSKMVAYPAKIGEKWSVIVDWTEGPLYDEIIVFPGGKRLFESFDSYPSYYFPEKIKSERGKRGRIKFDYPNKIRYLALRGDVLYLVEETIK